MLRSILQKIPRPGIQRSRGPSLQYTAAWPLSATANRRLPCIINCEKNLRSVSVRFSSSIATERNFLSFQQDCLASDVKIIEAKVVGTIVNVEWDDGSKSVYPLIYLRDICSCPSCRHPDFGQRISDVVVTCKLDYKSTAVNFTQDGKMLKIIWSDDHITRFDSQWLRDRELRDERDEPESRKRLVKKGQITWGSEMCSRLPTVEYEQVLTNDWELLKMLDYLVCYGFAVVKNGPAKENDVMKIADRVGHTQSTFGGNPWTVPSPLSNLRLYNTTADMSFHNDMHFVQTVPGIQFFHCLKQARTGGESRLLDGFHVAIELNRTDPEAFRTLTDCFVANHDDDTDCGGEYITRPRKRTIELDYDGTMKHVLIHETSRDFWHTTTVQNTESFIRAYGKLTELVRDPRFSIEFKLYPGEMTVFNNHRLMHSRRGYPKNEERLFEGTYMEWDTVYSRIRVLARKLGVPVGPHF